MNSDERVAWIALLVGTAAASLLGVALSLPAILVGPLAAAAGYLAWSFLPRPPRRGGPKYWRGRQYWD